MLCSALLVLTITVFNFETIQGETEHAGLESNEDVDDVIIFFDTFVPILRGSNQFSNEEKDDIQLIANVIKSIYETRYEKKTNETYRSPYNRLKLFNAALVTAIARYIVSDDDVFENEDLLRGKTNVVARALVESYKHTKGANVGNYILRMSKLFEAFMQDDREEGMEEENESLVPKKSQLAVTKHETKISNFESNSTHSETDISTNRSQSESEVLKMGLYNNFTDVFVPLPVIEFWKSLYQGLLGSNDFQACFYSDISQENAIKLTASMVQSLTEHPKYTSLNTSSILISFTQVMKETGKSIDAEGCARVLAAVITEVFFHRKLMNTYNVYKQALDVAAWMITPLNKCQNPGSADFDQSSMTKTFKTVVSGEFYSSSGLILPSEEELKTSYREGVSHSSFPDEFPPGHNSNEEEGDSLPPESKEGPLFNQIGEANKSSAKTFRKQSSSTVFPYADTYTSSITGILQNNGLFSNPFAILPVITVLFHKMVGSLTNITVECQQQKDDFRDFYKSEIPLSILLKQNDILIANVIESFIQFITSLVDVIKHFWKMLKITVRSEISRGCLRKEITVPPNTGLLHSLKEHNFVANSGATSHVPLHSAKEQL